MLDEARQLIEERRFAEARAILRKTEHPVAYEWLKRLDLIAPPVEPERIKTTTVRRIFYAISIIALIIGVFGVAARLTGGHRDANYGSYVVWGLWVAMYLFFVGVAAGGFMLATLDYLFDLYLFKGTGKYALWVALVSLAAGLLSIWFDLGHMERIWKVYLQGNPSSVMWQIVWGYTIFGIVLLASLWLAWRNPNGRAMKTVMIIGGALALFISGASGALLGVQVARPFWHAGLFPVQIPVFSLASGVAALIVAIALFGPTDDPRRPRLLRILAISAIVLQGVKLYFLWAEFSQSTYGNIAANEQAIREVLFGQYWWGFWILQLGLGSLIPIIILAQPRFAQRAYWAGAMGVLMLVGFAVTRANIVFPALTVPELEALTTAFSHRHLQFEYFPSLMEWAVAAGTVGLATLGFLIGCDFVLPSIPEPDLEVSHA
ncbi:MAG: polysulfide reductase [Chloroflexi bacterium]|nr:MAG: polysulfide reductase [Chloroflexota bacterium]